MKHRSLISLILCFAIVLAMIPQVKADNSFNYNADDAISYARRHWDDGKGLCAEFVCRCLQAGGLDIPTEIYTDKVVKWLMNNGYERVVLNGYSGPKTNWNSFFAVNNPNVEAGDVVCFCPIGKEETETNPAHVGIIAEVYYKQGNGKDRLTMYAHNTAVSPHETNYAMLDHCTNEAKTASYAAFVFKMSPTFLDTNKTTPFIDNVSVSNISAHSATVSARIRFPENCPSTAWGLDLGPGYNNMSNITFVDSSKNSPPELSKCRISNGYYSYNVSVELASEGKNSFGDNISLASNMQFTFRFWVQYKVNGDSRYEHSEVMDFRTLSVSPPYFSNVTNSTPTETKVTISGKINYSSDNIPIANGLYLGTSPNNLDKVKLTMKQYGSGTTVTSTDQPIGSNAALIKAYPSSIPVSIAVGGGEAPALNAGTTYYYQLWVTDASGEEYRSEVGKYFTTAGTNSTTTPVVALSKDNTLHSYERYDNVSYTWTNAKSFCESKGGHLVTIADSTEQNYIVNNVLSGCAKNIYFIGGTDAAKEGTWTWLTGEKFSYSNWDQTKPEPSNESGENYAAIMGKDVGSNKQKGEWIDIFNNGDSRYSGYHLSDCGFICEYDYVVYNANGGSNAPGRQLKSFGKDLTLSSQKPTRTGYTFLGWATTKNATSAQYNAGGKYSVNAAVTLYAIWRPNVLSMKYNVNGGTTNNNTYSAAENGMIQRNGADCIVKWDYNTTYPDGLLDAASFGMTRLGYTFVGWSTKADGSATVYGEDDKTIKSQTINPAVANGDASTTLYAIWTPNLLTMQYNTNGGIIGTNQYDFSQGTNGTILRSGNTTVSTWKYGQTYVGGLINNTTFGMSRTGYTFKGWSLKADGSTTVYDQNLDLKPETLYPGLVNENGTITLYAIWKPNVLTLSYHANGGKVTSGSFEVGTTGIMQKGGTDYTQSWNYGYAPQNGLSNITSFGLERPGYTFAGWSTAQDGSGTVFDQQDGTVTGEKINPALANGNASAVLFAVWKPVQFENILTLPNTLTIIEDEAFVGISAEAVVVPDTVTTIADNAFDKGIFIIGASGSEADAFAARNGLTFINASDYHK